MYIMKKLLSLILCLAMVFGVFSVCAFTVSAQDVELAETGANANIGTNFYSRIVATGTGGNEISIYGDWDYEDGGYIWAGDTTEYHSTIWLFTRQSDESYLIKDISNNTYLRCTGGNTALGNYSGEPDDYCRWFIRGDKEIGYILIPMTNTSRAIGNTGAQHVSCPPGDEVDVNDYFELRSLTLSTRFNIYCPADITSLPYPTLTVSNFYDYYGQGVLLNWNYDKKVGRYAVYRYNDSKSKWDFIAYTFYSDYLDKSVKSGTTYKYAVKTASPVASPLSASKSIKYLSAPQVTVSVNGTGNAVVSWKKVTGAAKYRAFFKTETGSWTKIGDTTGTSIEFKNTSKYFGQYLYYTARCITSDGKKFTSAYDTYGETKCVLKPPTVKATMRPNGYILSWGSDPDAYEYNVLVKSKATDWKWKVAATVKGTSYTYKSVANGQAYYFAVRIVGDGWTVNSGLKSTAKQTFTTAPKITKIVSSGGYTTVTYGKVGGLAKKYRVFTWNGKSWVAKGTAVGNAIKFKNDADARKNKIIMVRALNGNGALISSYWESSKASNGKITYYQPGGLSSKNKF